MMAHVTGNVWIGTAIGILKGWLLIIIIHSLYSAQSILIGVSLKDDVSVNYMPANTDLKQMDRSQEMLCMCWGEDKSMV